MAHAYIVTMTHFYAEALNALHCSTIDSRAEGQVFYYRWSTRTSTRLVAGRHVVYAHLLDIVIFVRSGQSCRSCGYAAKACK